MHLIMWEDSVHVHENSLQLILVLQEIWCYQVSCWLQIQHKANEYCHTSQQYHTWDRCMQNWTSADNQEKTVPEDLHNFPSKACYKNTEQLHVTMLYKNRQTDPRLKYIKWFVVCRSTSGSVHTMAEGWTAHCLWTVQSPRSKCRRGRAFSTWIVCDACRRLMTWFMTSVNDSITRTLKQQKIIKARRSSEGQNIHEVEVFNDKQKSTLTHRESSSVIKLPRNSKPSPSGESAIILSRATFASSLTALNMLTRWAQHIRTAAETSLGVGRRADWSNSRITSFSHSLIACGCK